MSKKPISRRVELPKNSKGGIEIKKDDVKAAWNMIMVGKSEEKRDLDPADLSQLKMVIGAIYPGTTLKELSWIIGKRESISMDAMYGLMADNVIEEGIDPIKEAFEHLCDSNRRIKLDKFLEIFKELPGEIGEGLDMEVMREVFKHLVTEFGLKKLTGVEDNEISEDTFRALCSYGRPGDDDGYD